MSLVVFVFRAACWNYFYFVGTVTSSFVRLARRVFSEIIEGLAALGLPRIFHDPVGLQFHVECIGIEDVFELRFVGYWIAVDIRVGIVVCFLFSFIFTGAKFDDREKHDLQEFPNHTLQQRDHDEEHYNQKVRYNSDQSFRSFGT